MAQKTGIPKWVALASGNMDQNLRNPCLILSHTHVASNSSLRQRVLERDAGFSMKYSPVILKPNKLGGCPKEIPLAMMVYCVLCRSTGGPKCDLCRAVGGRGYQHRGRQILLFPVDSLFFSPCSHGSSSFRSIRSLLV